MDTQIIRQYAQDQLHVSDQDRSLFALPLQVRICQHTQHQKWQWVETVDIAHHSWEHQTSAEETEHSVWMAPLWQPQEGRRPQVRLQPT